MWQGRTYKYTTNPEQKLSFSGVYLEEDFLCSKYLSQYENLKEDEIMQEADHLTDQHKKFLARFRLGEYLCAFAARGLNPFLDGVLKGLPAFLGRILLLLVLLSCTQKILPAILLYSTLHLIILLVGKQIWKVNKQKLYEIEEMSNVLLSLYKAYKYSKYGIQNGMLYFDHNSIWVTDSGSVCAKMHQDICCVEIYQLGKEEEQKKYYASIYNYQDKSILNFNEKIASLAFNQKFGVISKKGHEMDCMKLFSPHTQLTLIKSPVISNFSWLSISGGKLSAKTKYCVSQPSPISIFIKNPIVRYFQNVDTYCAAFKEMGDQVYKELRQVDVLLGQRI